MAFGRSFIRWLNVVLATAVFALLVFIAVNSRHKPEAVLQPIAINDQAARQLSAALKRDSRFSSVQLSVIETGEIATVEASEDTPLKDRSDLENIVKHYTNVAVDYLPRSMMKH